MYDKKENLAMKGFVPESEVKKIDVPEVEEQELENDPEVFISGRCHSYFTLPIEVKG